MKHFITVLMAGLALAACGAAGNTESSVSAAQNTAQAAAKPVFNFQTRTVRLNSGYEMPIIGIGVFTLTDDEAENSVLAALKEGYRLIDTAHI